MRYLIRKPVSSTETPAASGEGLVEREGFMAGSPEQIEKLAKQKKLDSWRQYKPKNKETGKPYTFKEWSNLSRDKRFQIVEQIRNPIEYLEQKSKKNREQYLKKREERIEYQKEYYKKNREEINKEKYAKQSSDPLSSSKAVLREERNKLLDYMAKASRENPNFETIVENGKFIGVKDVRANQIYTHAAYKGPTGISITQHPDYEETKYFIQQAKKFKFDKPEKLLGSYFSSYETMPTYNEIYNFFYKNPNAPANQLTRNSLELHHVALMKNEPTKGIQLNLAEKNTAANKIISDFTKEGSELYQNVELANERAKKLGIRLKLPDTETFIGAPERTPGQSIGVAKREVVKKFKDALEKNPELVDDIAKRFNLKTLFNDPVGLGAFLETEVGQRLSKSAPNFLKGITKVSAMTGAPVNALIGIVANSEDFKEQGLSDLETLAAGAYKGGTQDFLNFADLIVRKLPVATYEKFVEDKPFFENILNKPEYFEFADKQIDKYTESKSLQDRLQNRAEYEVRKSFPVNVSDTDVPVTVTAEENKNLIETKKAEILNQNPEFKQAYEQELATPKVESEKKDPFSNLIFGPIAFPKYTQEELNLAYGGRAKFANGTEEDDLYIPPLDKPSGTDIPREGLSGLYFGFRDEPKRVPVDPETGRPIESGGAKELKQILSSLLPEKKPEIGFANERFNISASKSINPYDEDRSTKYQASYKPSKDSGEFLIEKTPEYTAGGYGYNKDGLTYGISGLVDKMGNKNISARIKYDFATGGRVNFSAGGGAIKLARMITDVLGDLREKLFMPAHTQRTTGAKEAKELATRPYTHPTNQSRQSNILEGIEKSKTLLPKEYHSILDDIKKDVENFDYASASNRATALNNEIPDALNFEKLPKDIFPILDPLNDSFIIFDPKREKMMSRYTHRISIDPKTGRGTRETYDVWDSQNQRFNEGFEEKLIGVESLEKGKEGLN